MRLKDRVAVVTGSSRGIGRAIALAFAREGAHVVVNYFRSEGNAKEVVSEIRGMGRKGFAVKADVSEIEEVQAMIDEALRRFGKIDILVNNAAEFRQWIFHLTVQIGRVGTE